MSLGLRKGDRVTVCDIATGAPLDVTRIRGVLVAGRYSTGEIGHTRYWNARGVCENDGRLSIRLYRERDEERIEAAREVADAQSRDNIARANVADAQRRADAREREATEARARVPEVEAESEAAGVALADARARLARIDEVAT